MKKKILLVKRTIKRSNYISSSPKYKIIFLVNILFTLIMCAGYNNNVFSAGDLLLKTMNNSFFSIYVFGLLLFASSITIVCFDNAKSSIIRFNNKHEYLENLLAVVGTVNFICFMMLMASLFIFSLLFTGSPIEFGIHNIYGISNLIYLIYLSLKVFLICNIFGLLFTTLYKTVNLGISILITFILFFIKDCFPIYLEENLTINSFHFNINYHILGSPYPFLVEDIFCFLIVFLLLLFAFKFLVYLLQKSKKDILYF